MLATPIWALEQRENLAAGPWLDPLRQGILLELGMPVGGSSALRSQATEPHLRNPGREASLGGDFALSWRSDWWRIGVVAAYDKFSTTADRPSGPGFWSGSTYFYYDTMRHVDVNLLDRTSVRLEAELALPVARVAALTVTGSLGRNQIDPHGYWTGDIPLEGGAGWIGGVQAGCELFNGMGNARMELGWERFSYSLAGQDQIRKGFVDDRFVFEVRMGLCLPVSHPTRFAEEGRSASNADTTAGSRSPESILRVIRQNIGGFQYSYQKFLRDQPDLGGKISMKFTIAPAGDVIQAKIVSSNTGSPPLDEEILEKARRMKFDRIEKGNVTVTYAFVLDKQ